MYIIKLVINFLLIKILQRGVNVYKIHFDTYRISIKTRFYKNMRLFTNIHYCVV